MAAAKWACGALGAASALALHWAGSDGGPGAAAHCHAAAEQSSPAAAAAAAEAEAQLAALPDWLRAQGADVDAIEFKQSSTDAGRYGVYAGTTALQRAARGWAGTVAGWAGFGRDAPIAVAAFPLSGALTAANLVGRPGGEGAALQELLQAGAVDERGAVMLHLALERQRLRERGAGAAAGAASPWVALLPQHFSTTPYWSELDLHWLRGTTLHKATRLRQKSLRDSWARLEPAAAQLAEAAGLAGAPSLDDWVWANSVFWSRAVAFPAPAPEGRVVMQEGIVPGLDFCNHDGASRCKWTVFGEAANAARRRRRSAAAQPDAVRLVCPRRAVPAAGGELTIRYGDKGNEELLFLYGFAVPDNPAEVLTLMCPLPPPAEWDAALQARLQLLAARGLKPQLHLPAADLLSSGGTAGGKAGGGSGGVSDADLPPHVLETLSIFVMQPAGVAAALEAAADGSTSGSGSVGSGQAGGGGGSSEAAAAAAAGQRMAVLTTLVRLLELKALEMEGREEGTGPLEQDEQFLSAAHDALPRNQRHALLYRTQQKRLARAYLAHAKRLLQQQMVHLARLQQEQ